MKCRRRISVLIFLLKKVSARDHQSVWTAFAVFARSLDHSVQRDAVGGGRSPPIAPSNRRMTRRMGHTGGG
jgi:hypothetical protein